MSDLEAAIASRLESFTADQVADRLWDRDGSLWAASGKAPDAVAAWLGWLDLPDAMSERVTELEHLARDVRADGYGRVAVLGMGGSSLAPELFARVFGWAGGPAGNGAASADGLELRILDSTHPDVVRGFRSWASEQRTLFCVSSKSGTTTEPNAYQAAMSETAPALDFLAITDPDTALAELARAQEFRAIVTAPPDVGGRYSALTVFGLVPAVLNGVDVGALLSRARTMADACRTADAAANPGLALGALLGEAALAGRDKLTFLTSPRLAAFGDWAEQLIAESTRTTGASCSSPWRVTPIRSSTPWPMPWRPSATRWSDSSSPIPSTSAPSSCAGRSPPPPPGSCSGSIRSTSRTSRSRRTRRRSCSRRIGPGEPCRSRCRW
jgi:hypothetical protein